MIIWILLLSVTGLIISFLSLRNRDRVEVREDDPTDYLKGMYLLKIPYQKVVTGYFGIMLLVYGIAAIRGGNPDILDLAWLILTSTAFLLFLYKWGISLTEQISFKASTLIYALINAVLIYLIILKMDSPFDKLQLIRDYTLALHLLGMTLGLGGTLILDILIFHFMRDFHISKKEAVIMHLISQLILIGLILLIVSGVALYYTQPDVYLASDRWLMKMTAVVFLTINGLFLNFYMMPKIEQLSLKEEDTGDNKTLKRTAFAVGGISMVSWLAAFVLAMIKDLENFPYLYMLIPYLVLIGLAIGGSQFAKSKMEKDAKE
ncbi:hypothetical protein [Pararhodonellum marinum]|uniref:hypothetical protein n=1 Tax=Pararhodonellum marinum TaxID=2755358 RepID=UPI00188DCCC5|nr:hypothetical protein [Pararhodonellum marinum]